MGSKLLKLLKPGFTLVLVFNIVGRQIVFQNCYKIDLKYMNADLSSSEYISLEQG